MATPERGGADVAHLTPPWWRPRGTSMRSRASVSAVVKPASRKRRAAAGKRAAVRTARDSGSRRTRATQSESSSRFGSTASSARRTRSSDASHEAGCARAHRVECSDRGTAGDEPRVFTVAIRYAGGARRERPCGATVLVGWW